MFRGLYQAVACQSKGVNWRTVRAYFHKTGKPHAYTAKLIDEALYRLIIELIQTRHELKRYYSQNK